jgi:hypothetical protein
MAAMTDDVINYFTSMIQVISVGSFGGMKTITEAEKSAYKAEHFLVH